VATEGSVSPWEIHVGKVGASVTAGARVCLLQELVLAKINSAAKKEKIFFLLARCGVPFAAPILPPIGRVAKQDRRKAGRSDSVALESGLAYCPWSRKKGKITIA